MRTNSKRTDPLGPFIDSLLQSTGQMMLIVDHMAASPPNPDAEPVDDVLRTLLRGALEPTLGGCQEDLRAATAVLDKSRDQIAAEIYFVPHEVSEDLSDLAPFN